MISITNISDTNTNATTTTTARMPQKNKAINFTCIPFPSLLPISIRILNPLLENNDNGNNNNNDDNYIDDNDEKAIIDYFLNELTGDPSLYDGPTILELPEKTCQGQTPKIS